MITTNVLYGSLDTLDSNQEEKDQEELLQSPVVKAKIHLEEQPATALVDTGSPISIVSIDFLLQVLNQNHPGGTSQEDWLSSKDDC